MNLKEDLRPDEIKKVAFAVAQYYPIDHPKTQIVLHHSAGWDNARGMFDGWSSDKQRVATCCGIVDDGTIFQIYDERFWAYHVNVRSKGNKTIAEDPRYARYCDQHTAVLIENRTIAVEVCNWGGLKLIGGKYHTWASRAVNPELYKKDVTVDEKKIIHYTGGFRGSEYFERYTDHEIEALWKLIRSWAKRFKISTSIKGNIFDINEDALKGTPGIFTHCSYRIDKQDLHPQPEIIQMLNAL